MNQSFPYGPNLLQELANLETEQQRLLKIITDDNLRFNMNTDPNIHQTQFIDYQNEMN